MSEVEQEIVEQVEAPSRPAWLPDNFKTEEDFAKSYKESQSTLTRQAQELASLRDQQDSFIASQAQETQQAQYGTIQTQLQEAMESGDPEQQLAAMAWIAEQAAQKYVPAAPATSNNNLSEMLAFAADNQMAQKHDDWNEVKVDIASLVAEDPEYLSVDSNTPIATVVSRLERVYKLAKANRILSQGGEFIQAEAEANRLAKQQAQTITGASQRPATSTPDDDLWASIAATPVSGVRVGRI